MKLFLNPCLGPVNSNMVKIVLNSKKQFWFELWLSLDVDHALILTTCKIDDARNFDLFQTYYSY